MAVTPPSTRDSGDGSQVPHRPYVNGWVIALIVILAIIAATVIRARLHASAPSHSQQPVYLRWSGTAHLVTLSITTPGGTTTYSDRPNNSQMQVPSGIIEVGVMDEAYDHGTVSCELVSGGVSLSYNYADGALAVATCSN